MTHRQHGRLRARGQQRADRGSERERGRLLHQARAASAIIMARSTARADVERPETVAVARRGVEEHIAGGEIRALLLVGPVDWNIRMLDEWRRQRSFRARGRDGDCNYRDHSDHSDHSEPRRHVAILLCATRLRHPLRILLHRTHSATRRDALVLGGVGVAAACALALVGAPLPEAPTPNEPFIAFARDFDRFETWEAFPVTGDPKAADAHETGPRTMYLNRRPPSGIVRFPIGTIIVKTIQAGDHRSGWSVFAMVKRGGGYNRAGARDWEWFRLVLTESESGAPQIAWRGIGPPDASGGYGSATDCNLCHMERAAHNDAVQTATLAMAQVGADRR